MAKSELVIPLAQVERSAFWVKAATDLTEAQTEVLYDAAYAETERLITERRLSPQSLMELRLRITEQVKGELEVFHAATNDEHRPACARGCTYCCTITIPALPHEVFAIGTYLDQTYDAGFRANQVRVLRDRAVEMSHHAPEQRQQARTMCGLNGPQGECTVHAVNPLACAKYTSMDVGRCAYSFHRGHSVEVMGLWRHYQAFEEIGKGIAAALEAYGFSVEPVELTSAMAEYLESPEAAWRRWFDLRREPFPSALWEMRGADRGDGTSFEDHAAEQAGGDGFSEEPVVA